MDAINKNKLVYNNFTYLNYQCKNFALTFEIRRQTYSR